MCPVAWGTFSVSSIQDRYHLMSKKLYIRNGKVADTGNSGDREVVYHGKLPSRIICLKTKTGVFYFADEREAYKLMLETAILEVSLLPVCL